MLLLLHKLAIRDHKIFFYLFVQNKKLLNERVSIFFFNIRRYKFFADPNYL